MKKTLKDDYNIDVEGQKDLGPRTVDSYVVPGSSEILPGTDYHFSDVILLKYLVAQSFDMQKVCTHLKY